MSRRPKGHVEQLGRDRWRLSMELANDPITGRRRRATRNVRAASRSDALDELAAFLGTRPALEAAPPKRCVDELLDVWLDQLAVAPGTKHAWSNSLRLYVRPHIGTLVVADVDVELLERLWTRLQRDGGHDGGRLDVATVRKARSALRLAFAQALRWRWVTHNAVAESKVSGTGKQAKVDAPDPVDVARNAAVIEAVDEDLATWLRLTAHLGTRKEESLGLRWRAIDLDAGTVTIRTVVTLAGSRMIIVDHPKNAGSVRTISLGATHVAALKAMRTRHMAQALAVGQPWTEDRFLMSPSDTGERPYYPPSISRRVRTLQLRHKLTPVTIRQLRHHMATQAISRGHDVRTVAGRGGWANPDTLLRIYADFVPARDRDLADDLERGAG